MIVIGVGNAWRGDDGAGLAVARRLAELSPAGVEVHEIEGDATALMDVWSGADRVVIVDAAQSGASPGTVRRFDVHAAALPARLLRTSTHAFGVTDAIELARALGRLPAAVDVYAIEGASFAAGDAMTPSVERAAAALAVTLGAQSARFH